MSLATSVRQRGGGADRNLPREGRGGRLQLRGRHQASSGNELPHRGPVTLSSEPRPGHGSGRLSDEDHPVPFPAFEQLFRRDILKRRSAAGQHRSVSTRMPATGFRLAVGDHGRARRRRVRRLAYARSPHAADAARSINFIRKPDDDRNRCVRRRTRRPTRSRRSVPTEPTAGHVRSGEGRQPSTSITDRKVGEKARAIPAWCSIDAPKMAHA